MGWDGMEHRERLRLHYVTLLRITKTSKGMGLGTERHG